MRSFKEYVEAQDQLPKSPTLSGSLRTAGNRYTAAWKSTGTNKLHQKLTQPTRTRGFVAGNVEPLMSLANNVGELARIKTNSQYAINRVFNVEKRKLKQH